MGFSSNAILDNHLSRTANNRRWIFWMNQFGFSFSKQAIFLEYWLYKLNDSQTEFFLHAYNLNFRSVSNPELIPEHRKVLGNPLVAAGHCQHHSGFQDGSSSKNSLKSFRSRDLEAWIYFTFVDTQMPQSQLESFFFLMKNKALYK